MRADTTTMELTLESVAAHVNETHAENERLFTEYWNGEEAGLYTDRLWHLSNVRRETLRMLAQSAFYNGMLAGLKRCP